MVVNDVGLLSHGTTVRFPSEAADFLFSLNFSGLFLAFLREVSGFRKVIFLNFTARLLIDSKDITGKNWAH